EVVDVDVLPGSLADQVEVVVQAVGVAEAQFGGLEVQRTDVGLQPVVATEAVEAGVAELEGAAHAEAVGIAVDVDVVSLDVGVAQLVVGLGGQRQQGGQGQGNQGTLHVGASFRVGVPPKGCRRVSASQRNERLT